MAESTRQFSELEKAKIPFYYKIIISQRQKSTYSGICNNRLINNKKVILLLDKKKSLAVMM